MRISVFSLSISFAAACCLATPALADKSCFKQTFTNNFAERYSLSVSQAKEAVYHAEMPEILDAVYKRYIDLAMELEDAYTAFELFEVKWNINSHDAGIPDYEIVPLSLRPCVEWMWTD